MAKVTTTTLCNNTVNSHYYYYYYYDYYYGPTIHEQGQTDEMTYYVSSGMLNSTYSLIHIPVITKHTVTFGDETLNSAAKIYSLAFKVQSLLTTLSSSSSSNSSSRVGFNVPPNTL